MTSLFKLCRTEDQRRIAVKLGEHGVETDRDLLLADEPMLQKCDVAKMVPKLRNLLIFRSLTISVETSFIPLYILYKAINCWIRLSHGKDYPQAFRDWMISFKEDS